MESSRTTHPTLPVAEILYDAIKEQLGQMIANIPAADDSPDTHGKWCRDLKHTYDQYFRAWSQLMRAYRFAGSTESLRKLNDEKNNIKIEVNESIAVVNNILRGADGNFDSISDIFSVISIREDCTSARHEVKFNDSVPINDKTISSLSNLPHNTDSDEFHDASNVVSPSVSNHVPYVLPHTIHSQNSMPFPATNVPLSSSNPYNLPSTNTVGSQPDLFSCPFSTSS